MTENDELMADLVMMLKASRIVLSDKTVQGAPVLDWLREAVASVENRRRGEIALFQRRRKC